MGISCSVSASYWNSSFTYISSCSWTFTAPLVAYVPVAVTEDRHTILAAGHQMLDFYAKIPFYANMFSNAGFSLTSDQTVPDALVDSLVISGNESIVAARLAELLDAGLGEIRVSLVPTTGAGDDDEQMRLMQLIGRLYDCELCHHSITS